MSSYANHCWTPEREAAAQRLVTAAINLDDDGFAEAIEHIDCDDMTAVAALLAEQLADALLDDMTDEDDADPLCGDCGTELMPDTEPGSKDWQHYMVHDQVWADAGLKPRDGWFCIPCLETRLGRPLSGADLTDVPLNAPDRDDDTDRLAALKRNAAQHHTHHLKEPPPCTTTTTTSPAPGG